MRWPRRCEAGAIRSSSSLANRSERRWLRRRGSYPFERRPREPDRAAGHSAAWIARCWCVVCCSAPDRFVVLPKARKHIAVVRLARSVYDKTQRPEPAYRRLGAEKRHASPRSRSYAATHISAMSVIFGAALPEGLDDRFASAPIRLHRRQRWATHRRTCATCGRSAMEGDDEPGGGKTVPASQAATLTTIRRSSANARNARAHRNGRWRRAGRREKGAIRSSSDLARRSNDCPYVWQMSHEIAVAKPLRRAL